MANKQDLRPQVPAVGRQAPDLSLPDDRGSNVHLSDFRGQRVIVYFYREDMTSGCTTQACGFSGNYPEMTEQNSVVLGISLDGVEGHVKFKCKYNLPLRLLADEGCRVAEAYGVWDEKSNYGRKQFGIIRSHFVIDETGRMVDVRHGVGKPRGQRAERGSGAAFMAHEFAEGSW